MINLKKFLAGALSMLCVMSVVSCSKSNPNTPQQENGKIEDTTFAPLAQGSEISLDSLPYYDISNLEISDTEVGKKELISSYLNQLNPRAQTDYNDIKNAAKELRDTVVLSELITPEELFQIMLLLYVDDYQVNFIDSAYTYELSGDYVQKVGIKYRADLLNGKGSYAEIKSNIETKKLNLFRSIGIEDETGELSNIIDTDVLNEILGSYVTGVQYGFENSREIAGIVADLCRYVGIPCVVKMGILTDTNMIGAKEENIKIKDTGYQGIKEIKDCSKCTKKDGDQYVVDYSLDDFVFWNAIQLNDNWYNIDLSTNEYYNVITGKDSYDSRITWFTNVCDYRIAMSRIFKYNESLLGETSVCGSNMFNPDYRNGDFVMKHTEGQMKNRIANDVSLLKISETPEIIHQFEDEATYKYFVEQFDQIVDEYNEQNNMPIVSYDFEVYNSALTIVVKNIVYR